MVYVGTEVLSANGYWTEPAVIDPDLPVDWKQTAWDGAMLDERPSYPQIDPSARAGYLAWLAGGRRGELDDVGYVLLFFYGLERRILVDIGSDLDHPDVPDIIAEILSLVILYGDNRLFANRANNLLALLEALLFCQEDDIEPFPWDAGQRWLRTLLRFSSVSDDVSSRDRRSLPSGRCATSTTTPELGSAPRPSAARSEFDELFMARYRARYRGGLKPGRPARDICLLYPPASHGFTELMIFPSYPGPDPPGLSGDFEFAGSGEVSITLDGIPDITTTPRVIGKLRDLAEDCTDELDAYSRLIGRNPGAARTAEPCRCCPMSCSLPTAVRSSTTCVTGHRRCSTAGSPWWSRWTSWCSRGHRVARASSPSGTPGGWRTCSARSASGWNPDVRFGASTPEPGTSSVLFPLRAGAGDEPSPAYAEALPLVHLAAVVAGADGRISPDQRRFVVDHLGEVHGLDAAERARAWSHLEIPTRLGHSTG